MSNLAKDFEERMSHSAEKIQEAVVVGGAHAISGLSGVSISQEERDAETIRKRHEKSLTAYPDVPVDSDEYVVVSLRRHPIGIYEIIAGCAAIFVIVTSAWILLLLSPGRFGLTSAMMGNISMIFVLILFLTILAAIIGTSVYHSNKMVITNERAIQWIADGLFHKHRQVISLNAVEDISFTQKGVLAHMLNYGTVRLSTVGEESTYTFNIAARPAKLAEIIDEVCEASKNKKILDEKTYLDGERFSR